MRKSTVIILLLLLVMGGGLMFLADAYLGPLKEDAAVGQRLTRLFGDGGDLAPGTRVLTRRLPPEAGFDGPGLRLEATPSPAVLGKSGALRVLARALAREGADALYSKDGPWTGRFVRVRFKLPEPAGPAGPAELDVLLRLGAQGNVGDPEPALPATWPQSPAPSAPRPGPDGAAAPGAAGPEPASQPSPGR